MGAQGLQVFRDTSLLKPSNLQHCNLGSGMSMVAPAQPNFNVALPAQVQLVASKSACRPAPHVCLTQSPFIPACTARCCPSLTGILNLSPTTVTTSSGIQEFMADSCLFDLWVPDLFPIVTDANLPFRSGLRGSTRHTSRTRSCWTMPLPAWLQACLQPSAPSLPGQTSRSVLIAGHHLSAVQFVGQ